jgi:hypothetical protein
MDWLTSFKLGKMTLAEALFFYLSETGTHPELLDAYTMALSDYQEGKYSDLAEGFGISMSKRQKNEMQKTIKENEIVRLVDELAAGEKIAVVRQGKIVEERQEQPLQRSNPIFDNSVYIPAGKRVNLAAETVRKICEDKKKT